MRPLSYRFRLHSSVRRAEGRSLTFTHGPSCSYLHICNRRPVYACNAIPSRLNRKAKLSSPGRLFIPARKRQA